MKILIIEDEPAAAERLKRLVLSLKPTASVVASLESVESGIFWFEHHRDDQPDLTLADIQLADGTSFEIFEAHPPTCPVIFTTAYDEYAIDAFRVHAIDYLLKPIKKNALVEALAKYEKIQGAPTQRFNDLLEQMKASRHRHRFVVKIGRTSKIVHASDIAYIYTESKISFLVTSAGKRYPLEHSLDVLEEMLDPLTFYRANRQFIVNINAIKEMHAYSKARLKIDLIPPAARDVVVSTERSSRFKKWLSGEMH